MEGRWWRIDRINEHHVKVSGHREFSGGIDPEAEPVEQPGCSKHSEIKIEAAVPQQHAVGALKILHHQP